MRTVNQSPQRPAGDVNDFVRIQVILHGNENFRHGPGRRNFVWPFFGISTKIP